MEIPRQLRDALAAATARVPKRDLARAVDRLMTRYHTGGAAEAPILTGTTDVVAYAAYRMPATFAAVRAALTQFARAVPGFAPRSHLDLGGGTGAAVWAAAEVFETIAAVAVLEQVDEAVSLGQRLAAHAGAAATRAAAWTLGHLDSAELAPVDLVTLSYVVGELSGPDQLALLRRAAGVGQAVVVVEPGTPAGFERVLAARTLLIEAGMSVAAPCPHQAACPVAARHDWCHFAARLARSPVHRRIKGAELGYEDEKFAFLAAVRMPVAPATTRPGRVLRHPRQRKGLVSFPVCTADGETRSEVVSKRHGEAYRTARDLAWGDVWPGVEPSRPAQVPRQRSLARPVGRWGETYDRLFRTNSAALLAGEVFADVPPGTNDSGRWGISVILRPDRSAAARLADLARQAGAVSSPDCWVHAEDNLHATVRALERYRPPPPADDPSLAGYRDAVAEAAVSVPPVRLALTGVTLSLANTLFAAVPVDDAAEALRLRLAQALARRGLDQFERDFTRDTWHLALTVHTGPLPDPGALVDFVAAHRKLDLGVMRCDAVELIHWHWSGTRVVPVTVLRAPLLGARSAAQDSGAD
ncbi:MAG TPA: small ribosomal subunit Rsm22 family protein [Micromonosporaceae bacterium]